MPKPVKVETVKTIKEKVDKSSIIILTDYRGLSVTQLSKLRRQLRKENAELRVYKNRLVNLALIKDFHKELKVLLEGPTGFIFGYGDPVAPAKVIFDFIKENEKGAVKGGIVEEKFTTANEIKSLSKLPSREVLLTKLVVQMNAPIASLVYVLAGLPKKLVYAVEAIRKSKEK